MVDNGNHLILSANKNFLELCKIIKSDNSLVYHGTNFQFFDYKEKKFWSLDLKKFKFPFGIFNKRQRIPNSKISDYFSFIKILLVNKQHKVGQIISKKNGLYTSFWEPFTVGVLNTKCEDASAFLLKNVLMQTFFKGPNFSGIYQPKNSWDQSLIKPAEKFISQKNINIDFNNILKSITIESDKITELIFKKGFRKLNDDDLVIFAMPPSNVNKILPFLDLPKDYNPIINIHFKWDTKNLKNKNKIIGMLNSHSHWVFVKDGYFSVTISAANELFKFREKLIYEIWKEISKLFSLDNKKCPKYKIIIEKKATYNQTPKNHKLVKNIENIPKNLKIIGDWTQYNFPSTIESSIISGKKLCEQLV